MCSMMKQGGKSVIRGWLAAALCVVLAACAGPQQVVRTEPAVLQHIGWSAVVDDVDLLAVSENMQNFLDRYVMPYDSLQMRLYLLGLAVNDSAVLDFHYNPMQTLTASEAFEKRTGNCIAFAAMFVAMARASGLEAWFQEVAMRPEWSSHEDTLLVAKHINIVVEGPHRSYVIDVSGAKIRPDSQRRTLSDEEALALYYNNLGAEALLRDDLPTAFAYLEKAIEVAPRVPDSWSNLGVVYARKGQFTDAELAYRTALQIDRNEYAALGNLYDLYMEQKKESEALEMEKKVEQHRRRNPYYLLMLGEEALALGELDEAMDLLRRAIRIKENEHLLHFAMARVLHVAGRPDEAQASLEQARELAPVNSLVDYQRPLDELVKIAAQNRFGRTSASQ